MKKISFCIVVMLAFSMITGTMVSANIAKKTTTEYPAEVDFTHTILGEYGTATWCGYCKYAHAALQNIYGGCWYPFYYVSFVCDKNTKAYQRAINELGLTGYPTVFFDGGYRKNVGAGSTPGAQAAYNTSIKSCGSRAVNDIDINLDVTWNGNAEMDIDISIDNNEDSTYDGHLHVYITEIVSSMGWIDSAGYPYTFPFLEYAWNQEITITSGGTWADSKTWDGHDYNDGYGNNFGGITYGNIMVIASVFELDSDYVDDTAGYRVGDNSPPNSPSNPSPEDGETDVGIDEDLSWTCSDPNFDVLSFDIYFGESSNPPLIESNYLGRRYDPGLLDFDTKYYWKIVARDTFGATKSGSLWDFTTRDNQAPNEPSEPDPEDGATDVAINQDCSWTGGDPDNDDVTYDVYFGDSNPPPKVKSNQSGTTYNTGVLDFETEYFWKIVAWDEFNYSTIGPIWSFTTQENLPPGPPSDPDPEDEAVGISIEKILTWTGNDPNPGDTLRYDVYFDTTNPPALAAEGLTQEAFDPGTLEIATVYYWQVVTWDSQDLSETGVVWSFTTQLEPNQPPEAPNIDGQENGKPGFSYSYSFTVEDPESDEIYLWINWGDGNEEGWLGPYDSEEEVTLSHSWAEKGKYTIKAKAKDTYENEGDWGYFEVTMPINKAFGFFNIVLKALFNLFPNAFTMLKLILNI